MRVKLWSCMAKHKYRGGRPKGVKNGESSTSKGKKWTTQEEKQALWKQAKQKVDKEFGDNNNENASRWAKYGNVYDKWVVNIQPEDFDNLTNDEIDKLIYDYKGNYSLFKRGTKEDDFDGKYGKE